MGCGCCCGPKRPQYQNGGPLVSGSVTRCFDDGRMYRIESGKKWYFYNDTQDYKMSIVGEFGAGSQIEGCGTASVTPKGSDGACIVRLTVLPLETLPFIKAKVVNGMNCKYSGDPFTEAERTNFRNKAVAKVKQELDAMKKLKTDLGGIINENMLLKAARKSGKMYVDTTFPPIQNSLFRQGIDTDPSGPMKALNLISWRRPQDFLPECWQSKICLFDGISPSDIDQGQLGDCYFLCAVAALAEHEAQIEGIFKNHHWFYVRSKEHKLGGWRVNLNLHGWWHTVIIDSYLPTLHLLPMFARNRHAPHEMWVSFLEKAYAKAYGSYEAIVAGFPWQALEDITGFPAFDFSDEWKKAVTDSVVRKKLFEQLDAWNEKGYLISVATPANGKLTAAGKGLSTAQADALYDKAGLATGHAYTLLNAKHFPMHGLCLLKIRNPWGNGVEWTGDWSDESPMWNKYPLIKLACQPKKKADGTFWMEWKDVISFFDSGSVCFRRGSWVTAWNDYRVVGAFESMWPNVALEIITKKDFSAYLSLRQKDLRGLAASNPDSKYAAIMLSVTEGDINGGKQKVVANSAQNPEEPSEAFLFQQSRSVSIYYKFKKDHKYFVVPRRMNSNSGNNNPTKKFVMALITTHKFSGSDVVANLVRIDQKNPIFGNIPSFDVGTLTSVSTVYQVQHAEDVFQTFKGDSFNRGDKVRNAEYQNVI